MGAAALDEDAAAVPEHEEEAAAAPCQRLSRLPRVRLRPCPTRRKAPQRWKTTLAASLGYPNTCRRHVLGCQRLQLIVHVYSLHRHGRCVRRSRTEGRLGRADDFPPPSGGCGCRRANLRDLIVLSTAVGGGGHVFREPCAHGRRREGLPSPRTAARPWWRRGHGEQGKGRPR